MTMSGENVDGRKCKLYYLTTGSREAWPATGSPENLVEITNVRGDLTLPLNRSEADGSDRGDDYDKVDLGRIQNELSFQINVRTAAAAIAVIDAFLTANLAGTPVILAVLTGDKDTAGVIGIYGDYAITKFEEKQPGNAGRRYWDVTVKPAAGYVDPEPVEVAAA